MSQADLLLWLSPQKFRCKRCDGCMLNPVRVNSIICCASCALPTENVKGVDDSFLQAIVNWWDFYHLSKDLDLFTCSGCKQLNVGCMIYCCSMPLCKTCSVMKKICQDCRTLYPQNPRLTLETKYLMMARFDRARLASLQAEDDRLYNEAKELVMKKKRYKISDRRVLIEKTIREFLETRTDSILHLDDLVPQIQERFPKEMSVSTAEVEYNLKIGNFNFDFESRLAIAHDNYSEVLEKQHSLIKFDNLQPQLLNHVVQELWEFWPRKNLLNFAKANGFSDKIIAELEKKQTLDELSFHFLKEIPELDLIATFQEPKQSNQ